MHSSSFSFMSKHVLTVFSCVLESLSHSGEIVVPRLRIFLHLETKQHESSWFVTELRWREVGAHVKEQIISERAAAVAKGISVRRRLVVDFILIVDWLKFY